MYKEYFITMPLIATTVTITYGNCNIYLRGKEAFSYIEGPSNEAVDEAFDFVCAIPTPHIKVVYRGASNKTESLIDPNNIKNNDWEKLAITHIPLESIPSVNFDNKTWEAIQQEIDSYEKDHSN